MQAKGEIDEEHGEFWVENPFLIAEEGKNLSAYERNKLFLNRRAKGPFLDVSFASSANIDSDSRSAVAADFNRDGAPDLLVGSVGGGPLRLFLNRFPHDNRFVRLRLRGAKSNADGIGARLELTASETVIRRQLFAPNGFMGQGPAEWSIGVGPAETIDQLTIDWPSGLKQTWRDIPSDRAITLSEGVDKAQVNALSSQATQP